MIIDFNVIIKLFLLGFTGSFTHCLGMCGGIAMGQTALRLLDKLQIVTAWQKFVASLAWEYYLGKATTYSLLTLAIILLNFSMSDSSLIKPLRKAAIIIAILLLFYNIIQVFCNHKRKKIHTAFSSFRSNTSIINRLFLGMLLGLLPCGLVYSAITVTVTTAKNLLTALLASFFFGLGTMPGLVLLTYSGGVCVPAKFLKGLYFISLLWNLLELCFLL